MLHFLTPVRNNRFFANFQRARVLKISPDSERSIGDISETEGDTDLRLAQF